MSKSAFCHPINRCLRRLSSPECLAVVDASGAIRGDSVDLEDSVGIPARFSHLTWDNFVFQRHVSLPWLSGGGSEMDADQARGVVVNFGPKAGTGAGSRAQDMIELEIFG